MSVTVVSVLFVERGLTRRNHSFLFLNQPQNMIVWTRLSENRERKLEDAQGEVIVKNQRKSWESVGTCVA